MDQPRHLFVYFRSFQTQILHKNCSLQQDSNSDQKASTQGGDLLTTVTAKWPNGPIYKIFQVQSFTRRWHCWVWWHFVRRQCSNIPFQTIFIVSRYTINYYSTKFAVGWIRTCIFWCKNRPLCKLRQHYCTILSLWTLQCCVVEMTRRRKRFLPFWSSK